LAIIIKKKNTVCSHTLEWLFLYLSIISFSSWFLGAFLQHIIIKCSLDCSCLGTHLSQKQGFFVIQCELATIIENILLWKCQLHHQCDGVPHYFTQIMTHYLNQQFPNQGIICGSAQNCPLWWKDLNLLDNYVLGYVRAVVYACKMYMGEELLRWFLSAARCINNAAVVCKVTHSLVTWFRKCM
jgi:hypothetical protein